MRRDGGALILPSLHKSFTRLPLARVRNLYSEVISEDYLTPPSSSVTDESCCRVN